MSSILRAPVAMHLRLGAALAPVASVPCRRLGMGLVAAPPAASPRAGRARDRRRGRRLRVRDDAARATDGRVPEFMLSALATRALDASVAVPSGLMDM